MLKFVEKNGFALFLALMGILIIGYQVFATYQSNETTRELIQACTSHHMTNCSVK